MTMDKIKTPIEWNALAEDFLDANGCLITAEDVADAVNTAADQSRVIAVLTEAVAVAVDCGYEAGRRAERERIHHDLQNLGKSEYGSCYADYAQAIDRYIDKLRAEPAESGE